MSIQKNEISTLASRNAFLVTALSLVGLASISTGRLHAYAPPTTITVDSPIPGVRVRLVCLTRNIGPLEGTTVRVSNGKNQAFFDLTRLYPTKLPRPDFWIMQYWNGRTWVTWIDTWGNSRIEMNIGYRRSLVIRKV